MKGNSSVLIENNRKDCGQKLSNFQIWKFTLAEISSIKLTPLWTLDIFVK